MTDNGLNAPRPQLWTVVNEVKISIFDDGVPKQTYSNRRQAIRAAARDCIFYREGIFYRAVPLPNTRGVSPQMREERS